MISLYRNLTATPKALLCFRWVEGAKLLVAKAGFAGLRSKKYIKGKLLRANGGCLG